MTYWQKRNLDEIDKLYNSSKIQIERQMKIYYTTALKQTQKDFEAVLDKYLKLVAEGKTVTPNTLYTLNRYWELQNELKSRLEKLGDKQVHLLTSQFEKNYSKTFNSINIPNLERLSVTTRDANDVVNTVWCADGKHFSDRIWDDKNKLIATLNEGLANIIITGKNPNDLKEFIMDQFNVSFRRADTIVRTELAHIETVAAQERYKEYGVEEWEIYVSDDERLCDECASMDGKTYPIDSTPPVPLHVNCRCTMLPIVK